MCFFLKFSKGYMNGVNSSNTYINNHKPPTLKLINETTNTENSENIEAANLKLPGELFRILNRVESRMEGLLKSNHNEFLRIAEKLNEIFGDVVLQGLNLSETGLINVVRTENDVLPSIYEIRSSLFSTSYYYIYPSVNFCRCNFFQQKVILGLLTAKTPLLFRLLIPIYCNSVRYKKKVVSDKSVMKKVLCVAEKNDAAKNIASILSKNRMIRREGRSRYNKLYCFEIDNCLGSKAQIVFTSVSGHLLSLEFGTQYREWDKFTTEALFSAQVFRNVPVNMKEIEMTLKEQSRPAQILIIWTDCDREGENIGSEVEFVCRTQNPNIDVYRAKFSEITPRAVFLAMQNLMRLDARIIDAVDCRTELDLRIGAAFTRLQTLHLRNKFSNSIPEKVISYGSCQFPTLGFIVERYKAIKEFVVEDFWKLVGKDQNVEFLWQRQKIFDEDVVKVFLILCTEVPGTAIVTMVDKHPKTKYRPVALDTIELEKLGIRKLRMTAKRVMSAAERLYSNGYISYPRTETNKYPKNFNLPELVEAHRSHAQWGDFATEIVSNGGPTPRNGNKSDEAHPPIHPLKAATRDVVSSADDWAVYELVVRHFLACMSFDAKGQETKIKVEIGGELFNTSGLIIQDLGYMRVYPYDKWSNKNLPNYNLHQKLPNFKVTMDSGKTSPPLLLSEADLIALMDKYGIGTDATHAEHIEKIKQRCYVALNNDNRFVPSFLGLALVDAYNKIGYEMSKPNLRANLESQLVDVCNGTKTKNIVLEEQIGKYKRIFQKTEDKINTFSEVFSGYLSSNNNNNSRN